MSGFGVFRKIGSSVPLFFLGETFWAGGASKKCGIKQAEERE